jgi:hypothetical protein
VTHTVVWEGQAMAGFRELCQTDPIGAKAVGRVGLSPRAAQSLTLRARPSA